MLLLAIVGYWILWDIIGYAVICLSVLIHIIRAEIKGYKAFDWLEKNHDQVKKNLKNESNLIVKLLWGFTIWPVRWFQCINDLPEWYNKYETKF